MHCSTCGGICCFADDSTLSMGGKSPEDLTEKLSSSYKLVSDYMTSSELKLNDDKTHLLLMTTSQKRRRLNQKPEIVTPNEVIKVSKSEKLLGITIHEDMKWSEYILNDEKSLSAQLSLRLSGLKKVSRSASFKSRLTIANGIFMSKVIYCIPLWSGCENYLLQVLQKIQNRAARVVTSANSNLIRMGPEFKTDKTLVMNSFRWRATRLWNQLPIQTRPIPKLINFKQKMKSWVKENIPT